MEPELVNAWPSVEPISVWPDELLRYSSTKLCTLKAAIFQGIMMVAFMIIAAVFKYSHTTLDGTCSNITVLLLFQIALWAIALIIHHYYNWQHNKLRKRGYNSCSKVLIKSSSYQFFLLSWWNAATVFYLVISVKYAPSTICEWDYVYSALNVTIYCTFVHGALFLYAVVSYCRHVITFNAMNPVPDIQDVASRDMAGREMELEVMLKILERQSFAVEFYENMIQEMNLWVASRADRAPFDVSSSM